MVRSVGGHRSQVETQPPTPAHHCRYAHESLALPLKPRDTEFHIPLMSLVAEASVWVKSTLGYDVPIEHVCERLHAQDLLNEHLAMPMVEHKYHPQPRSKPLVPDVLVYGDLLLLTYSGHENFYYLSRPASQFQLEEDICSPAGICNDYVDFQVAFRRGKCLPYRLHYNDYRGRHKCLDKSNPEVLPKDCDWDFMCDWMDNAYRDVSIEWLS